MVCTLSDHIETSHDVSADGQVVGLICNTSVNSPKE